MDEQIPLGPKGKTCPFNQKEMIKVCHKCPLWVNVKGKHPQSEEIIDRWNCSWSWIPMLLVENSQMQRQTGAAVESFRNEVVKANELQELLNRIAGGGVPSNGRLIEGRK